MVEGLLPPGFKTVSIGTSWAVRRTEAWQVWLKTTVIAVTLADELDHSCYEEATSLRSGRKRKFA
jgi:hypothetical protein